MRGASQDRRVFTVFPNIAPKPTIITNRPAATEPRPTACAASGCHPSEAAAIAAKTTLQGEVPTRLNANKAGLGNPATWEYTSNGGPLNQAGISDTVKQIRFLHYCALEVGSLGVHNPAYVHSILDRAEALLASLP